MDKADEERNEEHSQGWLLSDGTRPMFQLDYSDIAPPCYRFTLTPLNPDAEQIAQDDQAMNYQMHADATTYISRRDESIIASTICFWACKETATSLLLKDARPW